MNAYLEILRPFNALMGVIAVLLVAIISGNFTIYVPVACVIVFIFTGAGNAINDYVDHKIDAINKPERPIPSGRISLRAAAIYSIALFTISTLMATGNRHNSGNYCSFKCNFNVFIRIQT